MSVCRDGYRYLILFLVCVCASTVLMGCSREESLTPDPGASPFYPGPGAQKGEPVGAETNVANQPAGGPSTAPTTDVEPGSTTPRTSFDENELELEFKLLIEKNLGKFEIDLNPIFEKAAFIGPNKNRGFEFGYASGIYYNWIRDFSPGVEFYGGIGLIDDNDPLHDQQHYIFPVLRGEAHARAAGAAEPPRHRQPIRRRRVDARALGAGEARREVEQGIALRHEVDDDDAVGRAREEGPSLVPLPGTKIDADDRLVEVELAPVCARIPGRVFEDEVQTLDAMQKSDPAFVLFQHSPSIRARVTKVGGRDAREIKDLSDETAFLVAPDIPVTWRAEPPASRLLMLAKSGFNSSILPSRACIRASFATDW